MLRYRISRLAVVPTLLLVLTGCPGPNGETSPDVQSDDTADTVDIIDCPDGLVLWPEYDVCAPQVDECEAWEVPVIGGGCMAVGPRACPKLWSPEADVDCEPGELMDYDGEPCPEGFVLTEDEIACIPFFEEDGVCGDLEIPVLGGGCQRVGPEWGVPGQPLFDECGDGLLALPGGGCVMIGPRGCPKVWDPDADVDCEVGDVLPCPEGWMESEDGMYCHPGWDECPHGEVPLTGGGCLRLLPLAEDCPAGPFPEVPEGATDVLYVLADSTCTEGCGSEVAPYPSIQQAIDAASDGAAVLVGQGTYDEGLTLTKPVHVHGLCSALVEITGKGLVLPEGDSKVLEAGVGIFDVDGVSLSGMRIRSPAVGVAIVGGNDVVLSGLEIVESHGDALYMDGDSLVQAEDLWVHDTEPGSGQMHHGRGAWVGGGAKLEAHSFLFEDVRRTGIEVDGEGTQIDLIDGVVRKTNPGSNGEFGRGIQATDGCTVSVAGSLMEGNSQIGLLVSHSGTEVNVSSSVIRKTLPDINGGGRGIQAGGGCTVSMSGSLLEENRDIGLAVGHAGTIVEVSGSVIRRTIPNENGEFGRGVQATDGCMVSMFDSLLEENRDIGLAVGHAGTEVEVSGCVIRKTMPAENGDGGTGTKASLGSTLSVSASLLEENWMVGLQGEHFGTGVEISSSVIRKNEPDENGEFGYGILATDSCAVSLLDSLLESNGYIGLAVGHSGTEVDVSNTVVRKTLPAEDGDGGAGIRASLGCTVSMSGSLLEENRDIGLWVSEPGTQVEVFGSVIRNSMADGNGRYGTGIQAGLGCTVSVSGSLLEENRTVGLLGEHSGTEVGFFGSVIRKTTPDENGESGYGIMAGEGSTALVSGSLLEENRMIGLMGFGADVELSSSVIRKTLMDDNGEHGYGLVADRGSTVSVVGSLLEDNRVTGLSSFNPGTEVDVSSSVIRNTLSDGNGRYGMGFQAGLACTVSVSGSLLTENSNIGLLAIDLGTEVEVSGSIIQETLPDNNGIHGEGLLVGNGASGTASWCCIEGNSTAGITANGRSETPDLAPSLLHVDNSAILNTKEGGAGNPGRDGEAFGDGLFAVRGAELRLDSVVVLGNARAGSYYRESRGSVSNTVIARNGSYGLAMQDSDQFVDIADNFVFGNALEAVTENPQGLSVPLAPEAAEFFDPSR